MWLGVCMCVYSIHKMQQTHTRKHKWHDVVCAHHTKTHTHARWDNWDWNHRADFSPITLVNINWFWQLDSCFVFHVYFGRHSSFLVALVLLRHHSSLYLPQSILIFDILFEDSRKPRDSSVHVCLPELDEACGMRESVSIWSSFLQSFFVVLNAFCFAALSFRFVSFHFIVQHMHTWWRNVQTFRVAQIG